MRRVGILEGKGYTSLNVTGTTLGKAQLSLELNSN